MKRKLQFSDLQVKSFTFEHLWAHVEGTFRKGTDICQERRAAELYVSSES